MHHFNNSVRCIALIINTKKKSHDSSVIQEKPLPPKYYNIQTETVAVVCVIFLKLF